MPVNDMDILYPDSFLWKKPEAWNHTVWKLDLCLSLPRLWNLEHQSPTLKQANTTHLADEETENLQIIRQRVTWQKIKREQQALRWEMLGVERK